MRQLLATAGQRLMPIYAQPTDARGSRRARESELAHRTVCAVKFEPLPSPLLTASTPIKSTVSITASIPALVHQSCITLAGFIVYNNISGNRLNYIEGI